MRLIKLGLVSVVVVVVAFAISFGPNSVGASAPNSKLSGVGLAQANGGKPEFAPHNSVVRFLPDATASDRRSARLQIGATLKRHLPVDGLELLSLPGIDLSGNRSQKDGLNAAVKYASRTFTRMRS